MQCECAVILLTRNREGETERTEAGMAGRTWDQAAEDGAPVPARVTHLAMVI